MLMFKCGALFLCAVVCLAADLISVPTTVRVPDDHREQCVINIDPRILEVSSYIPCVSIEDVYDFHLVIGNQRMSAHLNILQATIPFFDIRSSSIEDKTNAIINQNLDSGAVKTLLLYAYTRKVIVRDQNAEGLLKAALFFQMDNIVQTCIAFLESRSDIQNVANIMSGFGIAPDEFILKHVDDWTNNRRRKLLLDVSSAVFLKILRSQLPNVPEERIFEVAYEWIQHRPAERLPLIYEVMENVRFPLLDTNYLLLRVAPKLWPTNNPQLRDLVTDAIHYRVHPDNQANFRQNTWPRHITSKLVSLHWYTSPRAMQMYDLSSNKFQYLPMAPLRIDYCVVVQQSNLYAIGGDDSNVVNVYDFQSGSWRTIAPMIGKRAYASAAVANGLIYVSGGISGYKIHSSTESYNSKTSTWSQLPSMSQVRSRHRLIAVGDDLYAIGGYDLIEYLSSVEKFTISTKSWSRVQSMLNARTLFGAAVLNQKIYVCGGENKSGVIHLAEVFDIALQTWSPIAGMPKAKYFFSLIAINDKLWAFKGNVPSTEVYDANLNSWAQMPNKFDNNGTYWETVMVDF